MVPLDERGPGDGKESGPKAGNGGVDVHDFSGSGKEGAMSNDAAGRPAGKGGKDEAVAGEEECRDPNPAGGWIGDFDGGMFVSLDLEEIGPGGLARLIAVDQVKFASFELLDAGDRQVPLGELFRQAHVVIAQHDAQRAMGGQGSEQGFDLVPDSFQRCGAMDEIAEDNQSGRIPILAQGGDPSGKIIRRVEGQQLAATTLGPGEADVEV